MGLAVEDYTMKRMLCVATVALIVLSGCRSTCSSRRQCSSCPPPGPIIGAVPQAAPPEIIFPSAPPTAAPATISPPPSTLVPLPPAPTSPTPVVPPAPNFPAEPRSSGFVPTPEIGAGIANVPAPSGDHVILEKPEFSETARSAVTTLKPVSHTAKPAAMFNEVVPHRVATGTRPGLRELDQLKLAGYHTIVSIERNELSETDRRIFSARSFHVAHGTAAAVKALREPAAVYIYASDAAVLRSWWESYFRDVEHLSADAAHIRADRLLK